LTLVMRGLRRGKAVLTYAVESCAWQKGVLRATE